MHTKLGINTRIVIMSIASHSIWTTGPTGGNQWVISGGSRLDRGIKWPLPVKEPAVYRPWEPALAVEECNGRFESVQATRPGQYEEGPYPGEKSTAVSEDMDGLPMTLSHDAATSSHREPTAGEARDEVDSGDNTGETGDRYPQNPGDAAKTGNTSRVSMSMSKRTLLGDSCSNDKCDNCDPCGFE